MDTSDSITSPSMVDRLTALEHLRYRREQLYALPEIDRRTQIETDCITEEIWRLMNEDR